MPTIRNTHTADQAELTLSLDELRILVHRLAPKDSFLHHRAEALLPAGHEETAEELAECLRRFHDRQMRRSDA